MIKICFYNQKGGIGKSTSSQNIAVGLGKKGMRVLVVDMDPQANTTNMFLNTDDTLSVSRMDEIMNAFNEETNALDLLANYLISKRVDKTIADVLVDPSIVQEVIQESQYENVHIIPSNIDLIQVDRQILVGSKRQDNLLERALDRVEDLYDVVIIDCPPAVNVCTLNAVRASNNVIIPIKVDRGAAEGFIRTVETIKELEEEYDQSVNWQVLLCMVNRNKVDAKFEAMMKKLFGDRIINTTIRTQSKAVTDASFAKTILVDDPKVRVAMDYLNLVDEMIGVE